MTCLQQEEHSPWKKIKKIKWVVDTTKARAWTTRPLCHVVSTSTYFLQPGRREECCGILPHHTILCSQPAQMADGTQKRSQRRTLLHTYFTEHPATPSNFQASRRLSSLSTYKSHTHHDRECCTTHAPPRWYLLWKPCASPPHGKFLQRIQLLLILTFLWLQPQTGRANTWTKPIIYVLPTFASMLPIVITGSSTCHKLLTITRAKCAIGDHPPADHTETVLTETFPDENYRTSLSKLSLLR